MQNLEILFWDIETSLQLAAIFQLKNNDWIDPSSLVTERYIICASWKWAGNNKVHSVSVTDNKKLFSKRYLDTRILYHNLPLLPPITSIDTYKVAKTKLFFNSNKLDYIAKFLG